MQHNLQQVVPWVTHVCTAPWWAGCNMPIPLCCHHPGSDLTLKPGGLTGSMGGSNGGWISAPRCWTLVSRVTVS